MIPLRFKKVLNLGYWLSDWHNFICITTKLSAPYQKPSVIMYRSFKKFCWRLFLMNGEWRKILCKMNMIRNIKNKHPCPEYFERYRILRNQCVNIGKCKKKPYFTERCEGSPKNQHFWPIIKPFISSRHDTNIDIMLHESESIISESETVAKLFNK